MNHNSINRRHFLKMTALASGALALAACTPAAAPGGAAPAGDAAAAPAGDAAAAPAAEGAVVSYWYNWGNFDPALAKIVETDEWKEHTGNAKLEYKGPVNDEAMLTAIASGAPPDCHSNHDYPNYFARGTVIPVQDMVATSS